MSELIRKRPRTMADVSTAPRENPDGVDRTLIRACLRMTPSERLDMLMGWANSMAEIADAAAIARHKKGL